MVFLFQVLLQLVHLPTAITVRFLRGVSFAGDVAGGTGTNGTSGGFLVVFLLQVMLQVVHVPVVCLGGF